MLRSKEVQSIIAAEDIISGAVIYRLGELMDQVDMVYEFDEKVTNSITVETNFSGDKYE